MKVNSCIDVVKCEIFIIYLKLFVDSLQLTIENNNQQIEYLFSDYDG